MIYSALFKVTGWAGTEHFICLGDDAPGVLSAFMSQQDLRCLLDIGRMEERGRAKKELDKIERLLIAYDDYDLEIDDLDGFSVSLRDGSISCEAIANSEDEVEKLIASHPEAKVCRF